MGHTRWLVRPEHLLFNVLYLWNIQPMFSATDPQQELADDSFSRELSELKRRGASILVVGSVRPGHQCATARRLLGRGTDRTRRRVLVSTTGDGHAHASDFDSASPQIHRVIQYETQTRCAVSQESAVDTCSTPSVDTDHTVTAETLGDLGITISTAIDAFEADADGLEPGELRVGVDSLLPLLDDYTTETLFKFIHLTNGRVTATDGMVHYQLPVERSADVVNVLTPLFDILVELREHDGLLQERWSLSESGLCSGWISLSDP